MRRREFIVGLGSAAARPVAAQAHKPARPLVDSAIFARFQAAINNRKSTMSEHKFHGIWKVAISTDRSSP
jgi:hypothetical protein